MRAEVIRTDVGKRNGGRKVKIHGNFMKCFANVLTVLPGVALTRVFYAWCPAVVDAALTVDARAGQHA